MCDALEELSQSAGSKWSHVLSKVTSIGRGSDYGSISSNDEECSATRVGFKRNEFHSYCKDHPPTDINTVQGTDYRDPNQGGTPQQEATGWQTPEGNHRSRKHAEVTPPSPVCTLNQYDPLQAMGPSLTQLERLSST